MDARMSALLVAMTIALTGLATAQERFGTLTGRATDQQGAAVPGVTVTVTNTQSGEVRTYVTDGNGQYRVVDLRPGVYSVTFTLPGFNTLRRDGIELTGAFVATVNADLMVGALEETVTVTGEAATIDVQSAVRQRVMDRNVIDAIPSGRDPYALGVLVPGVSLGSGTHDVGGAQQNVLAVTVSDAADRAHRAGDDHHGVGRVRAAGKRRIHALESVRADAWRQSQAAGQFFLDDGLGIVAEHDVDFIPGGIEIIEQALSIKQPARSGDGNQYSQE